jgi:hypothetical protein
VSLLQLGKVQRDTMQKGKGISPYTSCQVVEKSFLGKSRKSTGRKELYLRCSIQDYFIKFSESAVSKEDVLPYLNRVITVKMTVEIGEWDSCANDLHDMQSRVGNYVVIHKIIE